MARIPPEKDYIPEGFKKIGAVLRLAHIEKIKALRKAYGEPQYKVLDRLLEKALKDVKIPKKRDLEELG